MILEKTKKQRHKWSYQDNLIGFMLFASKADYKTVGAMGDALGMGANSMHMKVCNFKYLHQKTGLPHGARNSFVKAVYAEYKHLLERS